MRNRVAVKPMGVRRRFLGRQLYAAVLAAMGEGENHPAEVHLFYTDDAGIRAVNKEQRGVDKPTDVLSFPMGTVDFATGRMFLGDVIVSLPTAQRQARAYGHGYQRELCYLAVHGTLHLLGYDHDAEEDRLIMREAEERVLESLGLGR